jgi:hypothetical protein
MTGSKVPMKLAYTALHKFVSYYYHYYFLYSSSNEQNN